MLTRMNYCDGIMNQGLFLKHASNRDKKGKTFEFVIHGWSNSDYAKNPENWRINSNKRVFLEKCPMCLEEVPKSMHVCQ